MQLQFLGATDTVTGSKYLLDTGRSRILVDCGLFQGYKALRLRNWDPFPVDPASLDAVVLTHAHIDHSGYLPLLVRNGFRGRVFCTMGTAQLCGILLPDSAHLAEEDANFANRKGFSRHHPALPLYTAADAARAASTRAHPICLPGGGGAGRGGRVPPGGAHHRRGDRDAIRGRPADCVLGRPRPPA